MKNYFYDRKGAVLGINVLDFDTFDIFNAAILIDLNYGFGPQDMLALKQFYQMRLTDLMVNYAQKLL